MPPKNKPPKSEEVGDKLSWASAGFLLRFFFHPEYGDVSTDCAILVPSMYVDTSKELTTAQIMGTKPKSLLDLKMITNFVSVR
jgi:hypothetical protein